MNVLEREKLNRFLQELVQAHAGTKDVEAERLIRENCNYQPDASYLLVQRALVLEEALKAAQTENTQLRHELDRLRGTSTRFLNDSAWGSTPQAVSAAPAAPATSVAPATPVAVAPGEGQRGSALLGTMAGAAAGVVAGSFLFQGIEHMMGNARGSGFIGSHTPSPPAVGDDTAATGNYAFDQGASDFADVIPSAADLDSI